ncbi:MAG TPA: hypothetical protein V6D48_14740, partial [Oculatellaceae cyanobacterium]
MNSKPLVASLVLALSIAVPVLAQSEQINTPSPVRRKPQSSPVPRPVLPPSSGQQPMRGLPSCIPQFPPQGSRPGLGQPPLPSGTAQLPPQFCAGQGQFPRQGSRPGLGQPPLPPRATQVPPQFCPGQGQLPPSLPGQAQLPPNFPGSEQVPPLRPDRPQAQLPP